MRHLDPDGPARLLARPEVARVLAALAAPAEETRLVGGCVRDALLGRESADIDLATTHRPEAVVQAARAAGLKAVPTGIEHGTITVLAGAVVEVTTLREDVETDGRHAVVRFGRDFRRDAERRDFTINALGLDPGGQVHDVTDGRADLAAGRVRFIGDPLTRIREDALRILRFFRFHARFGLGPPDPGGLTACIRRRADLDRLSRERVRSEFLRLLDAPDAGATLATLSETGLLPRIIGGAAELGRFGRAAAAGETAIVRLAALAVATTEDAERLRERLRLSREEEARLVAYARALAALRSREGIGMGALRAAAAEHGLAAVTAALAVLAGEPRPRLSPDASLADLYARGVPAFPLSGATLVARGVRPGPAIGRGLAAARRLWLDQGCPEGPAAAEALAETAVAAAV